uniref:Ulp1 protease family, C-terminal catalytic domain-containing protein n=1 Tax=Tanacetum cinerariifolium TaxID=118510 RepID=A0A6L2KXU4_TANCI|nr:ulp1 protease family, C-terminal catalytic domain-containing protein [Tanacetum cinerariifolium]
MERKWMYGMNISDPEYVNGVQSFLIAAESDRVAKGNIEIFYPYSTKGKQACLICRRPRGYSTKGKQACPICEDETSSRWLDNCKKTVFMGHRRSLPSNHPYRGMSLEFDGRTEYGRVRTRFSGDIALSRVSNLNTVFGKGKGRQIEQGTLLGLLLNIPGKLKMVSMLEKIWSHGESGTGLDPRVVLLKDMLPRRSSTFIQTIWKVSKVLVSLKVVMWADFMGSGVKVDDYGFTLVDLGTDGYTSEPFILAKQATQVFFVQDPSNPRWHIIMPGKRHILGVDNVVDEEEYDQFDELPPFSAGIPPIDGDTTYLRSDHDEGLWVDTPGAKRSSKVLRRKQAEKEQNMLEDGTCHLLERDPITQGVVTTVGVRKSLGWVKGDRERHEVVNIEAIEEKITKKVTIALGDKVNRQKVKIAALKSIVAQLQGSSCVSDVTSDGFDDLQDPIPCDLLWPFPGSDFRVAIRKVYPTTNVMLHGSCLSKGYIKVQVDMVEDTYKAIPVPKTTEKISPLGHTILEFIEWPRKRIKIHQTISPRRSP